jgi:release factor glutamine methyltransferase
MSSRNVSVSVLLSATENKLSDILGDFALPYAERILSHVLDCSRSDLYLSSNRYVSGEEHREVERMAARCCTHEPLDYIIGTSYFFDREFVVTPAVLLPRPDTELIVELVLRHEKETSAFFAEIGAGSGIISSVLSEKRSGWRGIATDISFEACTIARKNRRTSSITLICTDLLTALKPEKMFDFIVSNPPYIPTDKISSLDASVARFEPAVALDGGSDGLNFYRRLSRVGGTYLKRGGFLFCEIGFDQEQRVREIFSTGDWTGMEIFRDLAGHPRVLHLQCCV